MIASSMKLIEFGTRIQGRVVLYIHVQCSTVLGSLYLWSDTKKPITLINLSDRLTHLITADNYY